MESLQQVAALEQQDLDRPIRLAQAGSEEELVLQREKLTVQRNLGLAALNLTAAQCKLIERQYLADVARRTEDYEKQRITRQLQNAANLPSYNFAALGAITRPVAQAALRGDGDLAANFRQLGQQIERLKTYARTQDTMASIERVSYARQKLGSR